MKEIGFSVVGLINDLEGARTVSVIDLSDEATRGAARPRDLNRQPDRKLRKTTSKRLEMGCSLITVFAPWSIVLSLLLLTSAAADQPATTNTPVPPPIGEREKIRFFFSQWHHFKIGDDELMSNLQEVGATVFADWGCSEQRARAARENGIHYFCGVATAKLRGPAQQHKTRLAVDKTGKTCPQRFEAYVAAGGDPKKPWGA